MSRILVKEIAALYSGGWRPFTGCVSGAVYENLPCGRRRAGDTRQLPLADVCGDAPEASAPEAPAESATPEKRTAPYWFFRGDTYLCLGCANRCALARPKGFQAEIPLRYDTRIADYALTPQEMVRKLNQLSVRQAAYCLNITTRQAYRWIAEGRLPRTRTERAMRIPVAAVREMLEQDDN